MASVLTHPAIDSSQNNTTLFFGNDSDISRGNNASDYVYESSTDFIGLLRDSSPGHDPQSNATQNATVATTEYSTSLAAEEVYWQERLTLNLGSGVPPFLIIFGTLGNVVSVIAFQHRNFRYSSTGFILTALSVVDIAALNTNLMGLWIQTAFGIRIQDASRFGCKVFFYLSYYLHQLSSWTVILLTVERSISVLYPFRCKELCKKRRIGIIWVIIATSLFAENGFFFRAFDLRPNAFNSGENNTTDVGLFCDTVGDYWTRFTYGKWAIVDAVIADFLPFVIILIGNILTISRILRSRWRRKTQMGVDSSASKQMTSTTAKLIAISAMFLILNTPFDVTFFYYFGTERDSLQRREKAVYDLAYLVSVLSYNCNTAFEFVVYFVGGRKFRQAFRETFLPCRRKTANEN